MTRLHARTTSRFALTLGIAVLTMAAGGRSAGISGPGGSHAPSERDPQTVVFAGGCFWGVQAVFEHVKGVLDATSGYAGGSRRTAQYEEVETGSTGHAESVEVRFDPSRVSFEQLLEVFFTVAHDPTQLNRQGPDYGPQYRSAVWTTTSGQADQVRAFIEKLTAAGAYSRPIVTEVGRLAGFYTAETYHQDYLLNHPRAPYIVINDLPKLEHLRRAFPALWQEEPATWRHDLSTHR